MIWAHDKYPESKALESALQWKRLIWPIIGIIRKSWEQRLTVCVWSVALITQWEHTYPLQGPKSRGRVAIMLCSAELVLLVHTFLFCLLQAVLGEQGVAKEYCICIWALLLGRYVGNAVHSFPRISCGFFFLNCDLLGILSLYLLSFLSLYWNRICKWNELVVVV